MLDLLLELIGRLWARVRGVRYGTTIWTRSGPLFYPLDPRPEDYRIADVARGIANEARFAGQTKFYYSVAEHSVLVSKLVEFTALARGWYPARALLAATLGLLHDLSEAYIGDVVRPLKRRRGFGAYRRAERRVQLIGEIAFGLSEGDGIDDEIRALVDDCDRRIVSDEMIELLNGPTREQIVARWGEPVLEARGLELAFHDPQWAELIFLQRHDQLVVRRAMAGAA